MTIIRLLSATSAASATTFGLFYLMQGLVAFEEVNLSNESTTIFNPNVLVEITEPEPREIERVVKPEPPVLPPENIEIDIDSGGKLEPGLDTGGFVRPEPIDDGTIIDRLSVYNEGDMVPIVRVEPMFPKRPAERGIEGWVVVEFTVTEHGNIEDAFIVEAEPAGYFERASLKAVNKFRYKPRVVDGVARAVPNVRTRFSFSLEDDE